MNNSISVFLDLLRFLSAVVVVLSHFSYQIFSGGKYNFFIPYGHFAVMIFFVLSGYVIAYITDTKEKDFKSYYINRFSRLYSVVIPVLISIPFIDMIGRDINPDIYINNYYDSFVLFRVIANLLFCQENWDLSFRYFSDGPLWSVAYEFWYYVIFSVYLFVQGNKKYLVIALIVLFIGPKIIILMPIWIMGAIVYKFHTINVLNKTVARINFVSLSIVIVIFAYYFESIHSLFNISSKYLTHSSYFLTDWVLGLFISMWIYYFKFISIDIFDLILLKIKSTINYLASGTFTLYLFHFPLLLLFTVLFNIDINNSFDNLLLLLITFIASYFISNITERKKYFFKRYITIFIEIVENKWLKFRVKDG